MKTVTLTEAQADFKSVVSASKNEPVEIVQDGERIGVFIPDADAELIEDMLLAQKAAMARAEGFVGVEASKAFLDRFRNAEG
jgi:prevent-host-death family protein